MPSFPSEVPTAEQLRVPTLGPARYPSPLRGRREIVDDGDRVVVPARILDLERCQSGGGELPCFERAGPRASLFFDPAELSCGIVTCGGLCPGQNDVIRAIVLQLYHAYGVRRILGYHYGYAGLSRNAKVPALPFTPESVEILHERGGTILASSRGAQDVGEMVDTLERDGIGVLFAIGGDGTLRGAQALREEIARRGLSLGVVGIPKTIDNDLLWIEQSFGFATAVDEARRAIGAAHYEAKGAWNGVGLVKLMGRHSGFIAAHSCLANPDANFCLVPECPFELEGEHGFLAALERRLKQRHHAVVVVAEGAAQEILQDSGAVVRDASGNVKLKDVGVFLRYRIGSYLGGRGIEATIKYIDPSYMVRSCPANALDSELCLRLGQHAVHAGLAGKTGLLVGYWHQFFTHVPIPVAVARRRQIDPKGSLWRAVLEATGQPETMVGPPI